MLQPPEDDIGALGRARERLYDPGTSTQDARVPLAAAGGRALPHAWQESLRAIRSDGRRKMHFAGIFFVVAVLFFLGALGSAGYFFYLGGNAVSVDKISVEVQGPTTIAGGDIVPLSLTITNTNAVAIEDATIEIDFPDGTRSADDVLRAYPRYVENLGTLPSGATVTRSVKIIVFGGAGETRALPVSFSYGTADSRAVFVKKSAYALAISSTPLSVSVDTLVETVSGAPLTLTLTARSNATLPMENVVITGAFPFGFSVTSSSLPLHSSSFLLGTLAPGASKTITLTGVLLGQDREQRVFRFTIGTAKTANDSTLAVTYLTQEAAITIAEPFINATLTLNGNAAASNIIAPGSPQNVAVAYTNTLPTSIENATVAVSLSGSAIDYDSVKTTNGFYRSADRTIVFSRDTDSSLATLAPGASGIGAFTFSTLAPGMLPPSPTASFTVSVSGTRVGQANVPEQVTISTTKTVKVATTVSFSSSSFYALGPFSNSGPVPPQVDQATTYTIVWDARSGGSAIAGGTASAVLPGYVAYTNRTSGTGAFSYDSKSRTVTWNVGDLTQGAGAQGAFQVSLTPSTSQRGTAPTLVGPVSFSGYDRFAGVQISASADPATTETKGDPGYVSTNGSVQ